MATLNTALVMVALGPGALATARRLRERCPGAELHLLAHRTGNMPADQVDVRYPHLGSHLRELYRAGRPLVVFCAAGIVIRALAPLLSGTDDEGDESDEGDEGDEGDDNSDTTTAPVPRAGRFATAPASRVQATRAMQARRRGADASHNRSTSVGPTRPSKAVEPPVLAIAEDGSTVVPLLGGLSGANALARRLGEILQAPAAITTSGELRFGACLLDPPAGYVLADLENGKHFVSDLLAGGTTRVVGHAPWLDALSLPRADDARLTISVSSESRAARPGELLIHPRVAVVALRASEDDADSLLVSLQRLLHAHRIAPESLAALLADASEMASPALGALARRLGVPLRFASEATSLLAAPSPAPLRRLFSAALEPFETDANPFGTAGAAGAAFGTATIIGASTPARPVWLDAEAQGEDQEGTQPEHMVLAVFPRPVDADRLGRARGRLSVVGLGPGSRALLTPAARAALDSADDILGYETYVRMAGPFAPHQRLHPSDNREERQRAARAFSLAAQGRAVVLISSGDPGVFAMAAAVLEVLEETAEPAWATVDLQTVPGVSAAFATAALAGAPLGHDFCAISLSDNLKPWSVIEQRLRHASAADLVLAFYNPISRARPWQLSRALGVVRAYREPTTRVVLGRNVDRPGGTLRHLTLGELRPTDVDMRTTVLIGASTTRSFARADGGQWTYTPRSYP